VAAAPPDPPFTSAEASATLAEACSIAGLSSDGAQLIRLGENAIYRLQRQRVVVRIARGIEIFQDARKEVAVASWLRDAGLPGPGPWYRGCSGSMAQSAPAMLSSCSHRAPAVRRPDR